MENSMRHITCLLPARLDRWLRIRAAHQDTSRSDLIRRLLTRAAGSELEEIAEELTISKGGNL